MSNKKQSSIEWLYNKMYEHRGIITIEEFEQAKEMHKEEIIESYCQGCFDITKYDAIFPRETSEQYYKETFEK